MKVFCETEERDVDTWSDCDGMCPDFKCKAIKKEERKWKKQLDSKKQDCS